MNYFILWRHCKYPRKVFAMNHLFILQELDMEYFTTDRFHPM